MGVAIVGASLRSVFLFEHLQRQPEHGFVTGIYDLIPERSRYMLDKFQASDGRIYASLDEAVNDPRARAVFVATSDSQHTAAVIAALKAKKHVYCDKPMATTLEDCDAIIEAAKDSTTVFYLGMNLRHGPIHETLHNLVARGELGRLLTVEASEYYPEGRTYFRRWNRLRKFSGGLWITKACHDFDLLNWMAGAQPRRVFASCSLNFYRPKPDGADHCRICPIKKECPDVYDIENLEASRVNPTWNDVGTLTEKVTGHKRDMCLFNSDKDTFDNGIAVVEYENGVRGSYSLCVVSGRDTRQMRLMGTLGSAEGDMAEGKVTVWKRYTYEKTEYDLREQMRWGHGGSDGKILGDFFRCCQTGDKPRSSWADGRLSVQVGLAATRSCDTGKPVDL